MVSAALNPDGVPRQALAAARAQGVIVLFETVYQEIAEVLSRPKFARVLAGDRRRETLELLAAAALWFEPKEPVTDCRDARDNPCLELALAARAAAIISGDEDLLVPDPWRGVRVLRPARFLE